MANRGIAEQPAGNGAEDGATRAPIAVSIVATVAIRMTAAAIAIAIPTIIAIAIPGAGIAVAIIGIAVALVAGLIICGGPAILGLGHGRHKHGSREHRGPCQL